MQRTNPQFNVRLDPEVKAWLDARAEKMRLSRTWLVNNAIREAMQREQPVHAQK